MNNLFIQLDSTIDFGWTVSLVGFLIVFFALSLLVIVFTKLPTIINGIIKTKKPADGSHQQVNTKTNTAKDDTLIEGNVTAAISLALHLYFDAQHDNESNIITIKKVRKAYSPWSSKIYTVTNNWPRP